FRPLMNGAQDGAGLLTVRREVVVGEEDSPVARLIELLELLDHAFGRLVALFASQIDDNVAELALERAAAARLDHAHVILPVLQSADVGNGRRVKVDGPHRAVFVLPGSPPEVFQELWPSVLRFADE